MKDLQAQIKEQTKKLTRDFNFNSNIEILLGQYKFSFVYSQYKDHNWLLWFDLTNWPKELNIAAQMNNIIQTLKPTQLVREFEHGSKKVTSYSPFKLQWSSGVHQSEVKINYISNDINVDIKLPMNFYNDIVRRSMRPPVDTESHYFGDYTDSQKASFKIAENRSNYYQDLAWYGGDHTTYCETPEHTEQFNKMLLTGEQPLG